MQWIAEISGTIMCEMWNCLGGCLPDCPSPCYTREWRLSNQRIHSTIESEYTEFPALTSQSQKYSIKMLDLKGQKEKQLWVFYWIAIQNNEWMFVFFLFLPNLTVISQQLQPAWNLQKEIILSTQIFCHIKLSNLTHKVSNDNDYFSKFATLMVM